MAFLSGNEKRLKEWGKSDWKRGKSLTWEMRWRQIKRGGAVVGGGLAIVFMLAQKCDDDFSFSSSGSKSIFSPNRSFMKSNAYYEKLRKEELEEKKSKVNIIFGSGTSEVVFNPLDLDGVEIYVPEAYENLQEYSERKRRKFSGKGALFFDGGATYVGDWKNGLMHGQGEMFFLGKSYHIQGDHYKGQWKNGERSGRGVYSWQDGGRYEGEWKNGKREGQGVVYFRNGKKDYEGQWLDGEKNGQGKSYRYGVEDKVRYEGEWKNGKEHGEGIYYGDNDQIKYDGQWKGGEWDGFGTLLYDDGEELYIGFFADGLPDFSGTSFYRDGSVDYVGAYEGGLKHGKGTKNYKDGSRYEGEWKRAKRHGYGVMTFPDGRVQSGHWDSDNYLGLDKQMLNQPEF